MKLQSLHTLPAILATTLAVCSAGVLAAAPQDGPGPDPLARPQKWAPVHELDLGNLKSQADLVIEGQIVDIRYAKSQDAGLGRPSLPYTFVSYRVDSVLKGRTTGPVVTLRFIGGFDPERGELLRTPIVPQFDLGDSDILFVQGNGNRLSPLVQETAGRLRVIDGQVYTDDAHEILMGANNTVERGRRFDLEPVRTTRVNGELLERDLGPQAIRGASNAASVGEVLFHLASIPVSQQEAAKVFVSVDISQPFVGPDFTAAAPPADLAENVTPTAEERAERASQPAPRRVKRQ